MFAQRRSEIQFTRDLLSHFLSFFFFSFSFLAILVQPGIKYGAVSMKYQGVADHFHISPFSLTCWKVLINYACRQAKKIRAQEKTLCSYCEKLLFTVSNRVTWWPRKATNAIRVSTPFMHHVELWTTDGEGRESFLTKSQPFNPVELLFFFRCIRLKVEKLWPDAIERYEKLKMDHWVFFAWHKLTWSWQNNFYLIVATQIESDKFNEKKIACREVCST